MSHKIERRAKKEKSASARVREGDDDEEGGRISKCWWTEAVRSGRDGGISRGQNLDIDRMRKINTWQL